MNSRVAPVVTDPWPGTLRAHGGRVAQWLELLSARGLGRCALRSSLSLMGGYRKPVLGIVQELCESRGGCPGLSVLTSLLVSVDVKNY